MKIKGKNIVFHSDKPEYDLLKPAPASRFVPDWYRTMPGVAEESRLLKSVFLFWIL